MLFGKVKSNVIVRTLQEMNRRKAFAFEGEREDVEIVRKI
jgi:hypothetical protein